MPRDPARTLTDEEFWQLRGLCDGVPVITGCRMLGVTETELCRSIYEGVDPSVLEKIRVGLRKHPVRKW